MQFGGKCMQKRNKGSSKILVIMISMMLVFNNLSPTVFAIETGNQENEMEETNTTENGIDTVEPTTDLDVTTVPEVTILPSMTETPKIDEGVVSQESPTPSSNTEENIEEPTVMLIQSINKLDERYILSTTSDSIYSLSVELNTPLDELQLPNTLLVQVNDKEEEIEITWISDRNYVSDVNGKFIFTPILPNGYELTENVNLPQIYVFVGKQGKTRNSETFNSTSADFGEYTVHYLDGNAPRYENNALIIDKNGTYEISMRSDISQTTTDRILVESGVIANITLNNLNIDLSQRDWACALDLQNSKIELNLIGDNILKSGLYVAGVSVGSKGKVTIDGLGSLTAVGGGCAAGIGGNYRNNTGEITINGGIVTARAFVSSGEPAGIGGGGSGSAGIIKITGGIVNATGSQKGIGSGYNNTEGSIEITGGNVTANGIGTGFDNTSVITRIDGNAIVFCTDNGIDKTNQANRRGSVRKHLC